MSHGRHSPAAGLSERNALLGPCSFSRLTGTWQEGHFHRLSSPEGTMLHVHLAPRRPLARCRPAKWQVRLRPRLCPPPMWHRYPSSLWCEMAWELTRRAAYHLVFDCESRAVQARAPRRPTRCRGKASRWPGGAYNLPPPPLQHCSHPSDHQTPSSPLANNLSPGFFFSGSVFLLDSDLRG